MIRWSGCTPFDVIDPRLVNSFGEGAIGRDDVESHAQIAFVVEAMVPPGEPSLVRPPSRRVQVNHSLIDDGLPSLTFGLGDMRVADKCLWVENVAVGGSDVDVTCQDEVAIDQPLANAFDQLLEELGWSVRSGK
jgi:hypothetical protein